MVYRLLLALLLCIAMVGTGHAKPATYAVKLVAAKGDKVVLETELSILEGFPARVLNCRYRGSHGFYVDSYTAVTGMVQITVSPDSSLPTADQLDSGASVGQTISQPGGTGRTYFAAESPMELSPEQFNAVLVNSERARIGKFEVLSYVPGADHLAVSIYEMVDGVKSARPLVQFEQPLANEDLGFMYKSGQTAFMAPVSH